MSTFVLGPGVLVALVAAIITLARRPFGHQPAMVALRSRRGRRARPVAVPLALLAVSVQAPRSRFRQLLHDAMGMRAPQPAETGKAVRISLVRRAFALVALFALLVALGVAAAGTIGLIAFLAGFFLEQAVQ